MRRIVLVGNCQAHMLSAIYQKFSASYSGDRIRYIPSYEALSEEDRKALATADVLVQQILDFEPKIDLTITKADVHHHLVPFVTAGFLWPFATEAHIRNQPLPFLRDGPYPPQLGDAYLNRKIAANVDPQTAVTAYLNEDLARIAHLDRRYELTMEKQRQRDKIAGYNMTDLIDRYFRDEPVFLSPAHPELRVTTELVTQFFTAMDAGSDAIRRLERELLITPFPKDEAPIHPSVCRHFALKFITDPDVQRYRYRYEGSFTFREFALRYMKYEWNRDLDEAVESSMSSEDEEAVKKFSIALSQSPLSGDGHLHLAESLARMDRLEDAVAAAERAAELDPVCAPASCNLLSHLFSRQGKNREAIAAARRAVALDPSNVHHSAHLGELLKRSDDLVGATQAFELASSLSPPNAHAIEQFGELRVAQGFLADGVAALRRAVALEPANSHFSTQLGKLLRQAGDLAGAEQAFERATQLSPPNAYAFAQLGELRAAKGAFDEGVAALRRAIEIEPRSAGLHNTFSHVLTRHGELQAAIAASREAVALDPHNSHYCGHLGNLLWQTDDLDGAEDVLRQATQLPPANAHAHAQLARLLARREGDESTPTEALAAAAHALELEPHNSEFQELLNNLRTRKRKSRSEPVMPSLLVVGSSRVHLPKDLAVGNIASKDGGSAGGGPMRTLDSTLDFELSPHAGPALQFINPDGKVGAAIAVRYEQLSGQGSFQYRIYDQKDGRWYEPFRINGDEHPPEEPNSRFNRHVRILHGFYTPGVVEPEKASMEFHCEPGQPVLQIASHKTNQPLMELHQFDAPEDGFPIIVVHNPGGVVFALRRNGDVTLKGALWAGGAVVIDAAVTEPKHAATKAYVDEAVAPLRDEIARLREELTRLRSAQQAMADTDATVPQAPDSVE